MQETNSPASGSPVSDGRNVYVFFGDFGILCYGVDGEDRWRVPLGPFNNANGHGASPVLIDDMLILICDQDTDSYVLALDKDNRQGPVPDRAAGGDAQLFDPHGLPAQERSRRIDHSRLLLVIAYNLAPARSCGGCAACPGSRSRPPWWMAISCTSAAGSRAATPRRRRRIADWEEALERYDTDRDGKLTPAEVLREFRDFGEYDLDRNQTMNEREWNFYRARRGSQNVISRDPRGRARRCDGQASGVALS